MSHKYSNLLNIYEKDVPLPGSKEVVKIKPLTTNQIKKLLVHENETDLIGGERILDDILKMAIISDNPDVVRSLLLQDRYLVFIEIRKLTKGSFHTYNFTCPSCKSQSIQKIDLNDLVVKNIPEDNNNIITILNGGMKLHMGPSTRGEQDDAYKIIDHKLKDSEKQVEMALANMAIAIKGIETTSLDETVSIKDKMDLIGDLPGQEYDKVKEWFIENDFGVDLNITTKCPYCEFKKEHSLPLTNFFQ